MRSMSFIKTSVVSVYFILAFTCDVVSAKKKAPKCCLPDVFEVQLGSEGGLNAQSSSDTYTWDLYLYYDYPEQRWGTVDGKLFVDDSFDGRFTVEDVKNHQITRTASAQHCRIEQINEDWKMKRYCLPEDAVFHETATIGYGEQTLTYDEWHWSATVKNFSGSPIQLDVKTGITEDCQFIYEIGFWNDWKFHTTSYVSFLDLGEELLEDNVFDAIHIYFGECEEGPLGDLFDQYRATIQRFLTYRIRDMPPDPPSPDQDEESAS